MITIIFTIGIIFVGFIISILGLIKVREGKCLIRERLGKFHKVLSPGIHFNIPFMDTIKKMIWTRIVEDNKGKLIEQTISFTELSTNIDSLDFPPYKLLSNDGCHITINGILRYKIKNPEKAVYGTDDLWKLIQSGIQVTMTSIINIMTYNELLLNMKKLGNHIKDELNQAVDEFGVTILNVDIQEIIPNPELTKSNEDRLIALKRAEDMVIKTKAIHDSTLKKQQMEHEMNVKEEEYMRELEMLKREKEYSFKRKLEEDNREIQKIICETERLKKETEGYKYDILLEKKFDHENVVKLMYLEKVGNLAESSGSKFLFPYDFNGILKFSS